MDGIDANEDKYKQVSQYYIHSHSRTNGTEWIILDLKSYSIWAPRETNRTTHSHHPDEKSDSEEHW
jgi:hypothetical protein